MNATLDTKPTLPQLPSRSGSPVLGIFIQTAFGYPASVVLLSPLRRLFIAALAELIEDWNGCAAGANAAYFIVTVRDVEASVARLRSEFAALGYSALAHIGQLAPDGWKCLYGQPDFVRDYLQQLTDGIGTAEAELKVLQAHLAASNPKQ